MWPSQGHIGERNASKLNDIGREKVVAWCPACYLQSTRFIEHFNDTDFKVSHFSGLLFENRDRLEPLLTNRVERRAVLHKHHIPERELSNQHDRSGIAADIPRFDLGR